MNTLSGQFVTGTFTADATSQVLTMTSTTDFGVAKALTVGTMPEPSAALLGGLGLLGLLRRRR
jgi:MYXO-CTERM domain-containing protein